MEIRKRPEVDVLALYQSGLSMADISARAGITRQMVWKRIQASGSPTNRRVGRVPAICEHCGVSFLSRRKSRHDSTPRQRFHSQACVYANLRNQFFKENRAGALRSRARVSHHFEILPNHIVHHLDGDQSNDALANLAVYASQSDHLKLHHGQPIKPLWDGAHCPCDLCKTLRA